MRLDSAAFLRTTVLTCHSQIDAAFINHIKVLSVHHRHCLDKGLPFLDDLGIVFPFRRVKRFLLARDMQLPQSSSDAFTAYPHPGLLPETFPQFH